MKTAPIWADTARRPHATLLVIVSCVLFLGGCSEFNTEYGNSSGMAGQESVNGFGAFRNAIGKVAEDAPQEVKTRDLYRLSVRELQNDAIVWLPISWPPLNEPSVRGWMEDWLMDGNHTLVLVLPDSGSTEEYFHTAAEIAPPAQRLEYRRKLAKEINSRLLSDVVREDIKVTDWFVAEALPYRTRLPDRRVCDFNVKPFGKDKPTANATSNPSEASQIDLDKGAANNDVSPSPTVEPGNENESADFQALLSEATTVLGGKTSLTTLARLRKEEWGNSQILIVSSGGLVTNFAMTADAGLEMADMIRDEIHSVANRSNGSEGNLEGESDRDEIVVSFLSSDFLPIPISNAEPGVPQSKGWELMTEMPLSLINMHVAFLGIVLCLMLLPVFGRPRHVRYNRVTHFGNHLSAMAMLMRRGGGKEYAHQRISQYLRHIRGETSGPWVLPEPNPTPSTNPPPERVDTKPEEPTAPALAEAAKANDA
ncbi:hypothetical protein [Rhodopirellula sallentina]|uniref:Uncharacterized protein n=1 Tax=Rhodopirellula sallentina SM41 TaxID=1263870 RepID=M5U9U8_9BACT|nr:hypothetical protein [Rhodopirellula sallentina]EMI58192.1 hypothetical protein RSSM_00363 [Rhodopirellula sallentina SM41]